MHLYLAWFQRYNMTQKANNKNYDNNNNQHENNRSPMHAMLGPLIVWSLDNIKFSIIGKMHVRAQKNFSVLCVFT